MYRRGYLAVVGAGLLAGCGGDGDGQTPTGRPTATPAATPVETAAETTTPLATESQEESLTGDALAEARLADASATIHEAHRVYVGYAGEDAATLLDVGPATSPFDEDRVQTLCEQARAHLEAVRAAGGPEHEPPVRRLQSATTWLSGAAVVQGALGSVAERLNRADATASGSAGFGTVASHLRASRENVATAVATIEQLPAPPNDAFEDVGGIDGTDVATKHERFQRHLDGFEDLRALLDRAVGDPAADDGGALGTLQRARAALRAEDSDTAAELAASARTVLDDIADQTAAVAFDALEPLAAPFRAAIVALRERAGTLRDDAQSQ